MVECDVLTPLHRRLTERGERIRTWREMQRPRMNQEDLGERIGVSTTTIRAWESGQVETIKKGKEELLRLMDVSEEWLEFGPSGLRPQTTPSHSPPEAPPYEEDPDITHEQHMANFELVSREPMLAFTVKRGKLTVKDIADIANVIRKFRGQE